MIDENRIISESQFKDEDFPPCYESLGNFDSSRELEEKNIHWKRLGDVWPNSSLFGKEGLQLKASDIKESTYYSNQAFITAIKLLLDKSENILRSVFI